MMFWYVLFGLIFFAVMFMWCPVYVEFYFRESLLIKVRFLFFSFVFPQKKVKEELHEKQDDEEDRQKISAKPKKEKKLLFLMKENGLSGFLGLLRAVADVVSKSAKKTFEKINIKAFKLSLVVAGDDAADTAIKYGQTQALVGAAAALLLCGVIKENCQVNVRPGFNEKDSSVDFYAKVCFLPVSVLKIAVGTLVDFVKKVYANTKLNRKGVANE